MDAMTTQWQETSIDGPRTRHWTLDAKQCPELAIHHITWLGVSTVHKPYSRVRLSPNGSFFLASLKGEGCILLEGRWVRVAAGDLCLAPPRTLNAFHAVSARGWTFAWVRYEEAQWVKPLVGADSPLRLTRSAEALGRAVAGCQDEWESERSPSLLRHWISLIHGIAQRQARPWRGSSHIVKLWEMVARNPATNWKLGSLAAQCGLSTEHLRRLCRKELGRTPMEHVTYMRIQLAQELLEKTDIKLEAIAPQVGYHSAVVFSRSFLRCVGMTPSAYRAQRSPKTSLSA